MVAGPVFRDVGQWALNNLRIHPKLQHAKVEKEPAVTESEGPLLLNKPQSNLDLAGYLPDFRGQTIREVLRSGNALRLNRITEGSGRADNQVPRPGSSLKETRGVQVTFSPPV